MKSPSEDQLDTIISLVRGGGELDAAVAHQGIPPREFAEWLRKPRQAAVRTRLGRATGQADLSDMAIIGNAANTRADAAAGTWQAAKSRMDTRKMARYEREVDEINQIACTALVT